MRVLLIHRYFWPDTPPYASMLLAIATQLVNDGHKVEVLTSHPSYKSDSTIFSAKSTEYIDGVKIKRIHLFKESGRSVIYRLLNMTYFPVRILVHILFNRQLDIVMSSTAPPIVTGFSSALGAKLIKAKFIYHCMDLHPEIGRISGEFKNPTVYNLLLKLDQWTCTHADRVIVLSKDMQNSLLQRPTHKSIHSQILNNFSLSGDGEKKKISLPAQFAKTAGTFRVLFAGNIGRFQMLESFIDAFHLLEELPNIELVFLGEGSALVSLKERAEYNKKIKFFPHQDIDTARRIMSDADLGIVSLMPNVYRYAFPSKTMTYLAEGCPLLVTVEPESELISFVVENGIGISALPNNAESIAKNIKTAFASPESINQMSKKCLKVAEKQFSQPSVVQKWSKLYLELGGTEDV